MASLLQTTKDNIKDVNSDFEFEVKEITRYQEAEMNQELFDKVLGPDVVNSEEEFAEKVAESLNNQFKPDSDNLFMREVRKLFLEKLKDVQLPDAFLKRWLLASDEKKTQESVEEEYPQMMEDLKFLLAKNKIVKQLNIEIKSEDVQAKAEEVAKAQFAQYGMSNLPAETLKSYVNSMLSNENTVRNIIQNIEDEKVIDWVKQTAKVIDKEISTKELNELFTEKQQISSEEEHLHDHSSETETETEKEA
ncbi:MAG: trigger factor [Bacteroidetes bacterium ADurb.BinA261]|nr:MAG: trigger factor [Bacteroidetes bacterium ADurb.BinA261]